MKNLVKYLLCICLIFQGPLCFAEIIKTNDFHVIDALLKKEDKDTLVIFDVDDVLLCPLDQILKASHKKMIEGIEKEMELRLSQNKAMDLYSLILLQRVNAPVDKRIVTLIRKIQRKGIRVLALTNCFTGPFGKINSMENWRLQELARLGYKFDISWRDLKAKVFKEDFSKNPRKTPVFKEGVVFACDTPKGDALKAFLRYARFFPRRIVFIDDKKKHLESVKKFAEEKGIKFLGIEYTAVKDAYQEPLNIKKARLQFKILEEEHRWISDQEADTYLEKESF